MWPFSSINTDTNHILWHTSINSFPTGVPMCQWLHQGQMWHWPSQPLYIINSIAQSISWVRCEGWGQQVKVTCKLSHMSTCTQWQCGCSGLRESQQCCSYLAGLPFICRGAPGESWMHEFLCFSNLCACGTRSELSHGYTYAPSHIICVSFLLPLIYVENAPSCTSNPVSSSCISVNYMYLTVRYSF